MSGSSEPRLRINAVSQLTGVGRPTLRAWERRYGIPVPSRTDSAYRLYSDRDVEMIKRMQELTAGGVAASEAARQVLAERMEIAAPLPSREPEQEVVERIVLAAEQHDAAALRAEARRAMTMGDALAVFRKVVAPSMVEIGERWHKGLLDIGAEHLAAEVLEDLSRNLVSLGRNERATRRAVLACIADELHVLPLYGVAIELASKGFDPVILGARTPPDALAAPVRAIDPALIGLSATVLPDAHAAKALLSAYARAAGGRVWIVGGAASAHLAPQIEAAGGLVAPDSAVPFARVEKAIAARRRSK